MRGGRAYSLCCVRIWVSQQQIKRNEEEENGKKKKKRKHHVFSERT